MKPTAYRGLLRASLWAMPAGIALWALLAAFSVVVVDAFWEHEYHVGTRAMKLLKCPALADAIKHGGPGTDFIFYEIPVCGERTDDPVTQDRLQRWIEHKSMEGYDLMAGGDGCLLIFRRRRS